MVIIALVGSFTALFGVYYCLKNRGQLFSRGAGAARSDANQPAEVVADDSIRGEEQAKHNRVPTAQDLENHNVA